jgi:hypothetical protein
LQPPVEPGGRNGAAVRAESDGAQRPVAVQDRLDTGSPGLLERGDDCARGVRGRALPVPLEAQEQRHLGVLRQLRRGGRRQRERRRGLRRSTGVASLHERPGAERGEEGDEREQDAADPRVPPQRRAARALLLVVAPPFEDRVREHVVKQLVPRAAAVAFGLARPRGRRNAPEDAPALALAELLEHGRHLGLGPLRPFGEIRRCVRDLRPRARDEEPERVRRDVLLGPVERGERVQQVVLDDALCAAELLEAGEGEVAAARLDGRAPQPFHHELEERRLDLVFDRQVPIGTLGAVAAREAARGRRVDHGLGQRRLERVRRLVRRQAAVPFLDRAVDRVPRGRAAEVVDPNVVCEQARDPALEAVELRPRVLSDREQEVHPQVRVVDDLRERARERLLAVVLAVVEEVLLELVEDDEDRPHSSRPRAQRPDGRVARTPRVDAGPGGLRRGHADGLHQPGQRVVAPGAEGADREGGTARGGGMPAQRVDHAGLDQGRLADAARPVDDREPRRAEVPGDDPDLLVAAEEEVGVCLAVRNEADVRRLGHPGGGAAPSSASSRATYSFSGT